VKKLPQGLLDHYRKPLITVAHCWRIHLKDGTKILGTMHDRDIAVTVTNADGIEDTAFDDLTGLYRRGAGIRFSDLRSSSDMSVDNTEAEGALVGDMAIPDLTVERIESGIADGAPVIAFKCNWQDPDAGQDIVNAGYLGNFERDSSGRYRTEVRNLQQRLAQNIVRTFGERCDVVRFGDARCGFDVAAATRAAVVTAVTNRRSFTIEITSGDPPPVPNYFDGAEITFTSGANSGFSREAKRVAQDGSSFSITLWEETPKDIEVGNTLNLPPACDRTKTMCKLHGRFTTNPGWQGYGIFIPGLLALMKGPT
jgi:uncharacterized phage protein (TIGR02218 family)